VKCEVLLDALADMLTEETTETQKKTLGHMETKTLVDKLSDRMFEVKPVELVEGLPVCPTEM